MTEAFKILNAKVEALLQENTKLMEQIKSLKGKDSIQRIDTSTQTSEKSFPSLEKMDEQGVHSPTNAKRSTVSDNKDTASPIQTVAGKDTSNPFMAVTLPKSEGEGSSSKRRLPRSFIQVETTRKKTMLHKKKKNDKIESIIKKTLEQFFQQGQDKHVITPPNPDPNGDRLVPDTERNRPNTSPRNTNNNITRSNSSGEEDYREHSYYQDAQNPNADDDSGMSFYSEALHNLDT
ncbi:hypothetical protein KY290_005663 [Solanum tuberosum]|uniref:Integrase core domain containing protein n=1 Tax=Solanum tuberosum TaxID=4113 RepID=A0ABQ7WG57_SOLTU|nr:hypothetical protein KY284_006675 [Solanum tuberosum]KAH0723001.1 hypothetical protein KY289_006045 [Solanum tuberosum]KAH0752406.1 hypothetical protein KY285_005554 [Solanum tuberosum]KAH0779236.1 hypothetical protein KY290_005663 [Solanum tuberosum]